MKRIIILFIIVNSLFCQTSISQIKENLREVFIDAEFFLNHDDHEEALYNYLSIIKKGVTNANIQYRIGQCYMNIEGKKKEAIPYLIEASKSVTMEYKEGNPKEIQAPPEVYFYLGQAYQVNQEFDKAIDNFRKYVGFLDPEDLNRAYAKKQLKTCKNAKEAIKNPKSHVIEKMSQQINNQSDNIRPVISKDGSTFLFMTRLKFYDAIFQVKKEGENWSSPKNINKEIKSDGDIYITDISADGQKLLLVRDDNFDSDIYYSDYSQEEEQWLPFEEFEDINSKYWESHASITADGEKVYFASNHKKSKGGMDIFYIEKNDRGKWGKPVPLSDKINTKFNEESPFITSDDSMLFFASQGHEENIGGYDIYYSKKTGNTWSEPVNLGYPINTPDDELFFSPSADGKTGYFSRINKKDKQDIFKVRLKLEEE
ncbi:MAG: hypothetical protein ACOC4J_04330 [Bacteroidota bacterium]